MRIPSSAPFCSARILMPRLTITHPPQNPLFLCLHALPQDGFLFLVSPSVLASPAASSRQVPSPSLRLYISLVSVVGRRRQQFLALCELQAESAGGNATAVWTPRMRKTFLDGGSSMEWWRGRRLVGRFQVCAVCTCCGGPHGMCIPAPCCYAINCNIPNRPFGVCSFTPRTCNCLNCHL
ncbi:hypothetical protein HU200_038555 [Digitaria exilis]|uniref:DUF7866 domain-containing protein n=1 Tax=Digitaria exilis TaxID=1010633 RepID=A0A835EKG1_9POAL|nr:hypothetical protein HU200_038555 [Digitaria exilis]